MGLDGPLREAATRVHELVFVGADGRERSHVDMAAFSSSTGDIELPRGDLARILGEASSNDAEYIFGDQIEAMAETSTSVDVCFESGRERSFDLVIGADGLHSRVRKLAFGAETEFVRHMGLYVATMPVSGEHPDPRKVLLYNSPGRAIAIHPARDKALCAFIFRHPQVQNFDHRDSAQHKAVLAAAYRGESWRAPELVEIAMAANDLYFDAVSKVVLNQWSRGRLALLGDAASCLSLFGEGSSLAIAGARVLAEELASAPDHATAFARYEQRHRRAVEPKQRNVRLAAAQMVPKTQVGIVIRNFAMRLTPLVAGIGRLIERPRPLQSHHAR
jgi:2-polyprenyl-6-methoxyphenol hydroxylase-like FAD-dependent oxidoreductase